MKTIKNYCIKIFCYLFLSNLKIHSLIENRNFNYDNVSVFDELFNFTFSYKENLTILPFLESNSTNNSLYFIKNIKEDFEFSNSSNFLNNVEENRNSRKSVPYFKKFQQSLNYSKIKTEDVVINNSIQFDFNQTDYLSIFLKEFPIKLWENNGIFTKEYIKNINKHWLQFKPASKQIHHVLGFLYILLLIIGVSGNLLVMCMFKRCRSLRTPANTLVVNLAISDFFMIAKTPVFIYNSYFMGPALGQLGCDIYGFVGGLTGTASIITLAAISIDRFLVIVYPLDLKKRITGMKSKFCILFTWVYALTFSIIPLLNIGVNPYVPEGLLTSCSFDYLTDDKKTRLFIIIFFIAAWCMPFTVIIFCYTKILRAVILNQKISKKKSGSISSKHVKNSEKFKTEVKLSLIVVFVIFLWFLAWTPYAIVALLGYFGQSHLINPLTSMIPALFCKTSSCINPFIYALTHPKFREEILKIIKKNKRTNSMKQEFRKLSKKRSFEIVENQENQFSSIVKRKSFKLKREPSNKSFQMSSRDYMNQEINKQIEKLNIHQNYSNSEFSLSNLNTSTDSFSNDEVEEITIMIDYK